MLPLLQGGAINDSDLRPPGPPAPPFPPPPPHPPAPMSPGLTCTYDTPIPEVRPTGNLDKITMSNVPQGSNLLWVHLAVCVAIVFYTLRVSIAPPSPSPHPPSPHTSHNESPLSSCRLLLLLLHPPPVMPLLRLKATYCATHLLRLLIASFHPPLPPCSCCGATTGCVWLLDWPTSGPWSPALRPTQ